MPVVIHRIVLIISLVFVTAVGARAQTATAQQPFEPKIGQAGKDVVWVPTPPELVEKMLDLAQVTKKDYVIDLGSGDGRNVIAAAKRGARALGVEFNPDMVALSSRAAKDAGVGGKARFVQGDMYKADISRASVMALFLLPSNLLQLRDKFLALEPGSRIVSNTFYIEGWRPDAEAMIDQCTEWCTAILWIVPAKVAGTWTIGGRELVLTQAFQMLSGTLDGVPITEGRLKGREITFTAGDTRYTGLVNGRSMKGTEAGPGGERKWSGSQREPRQP